MVVPLRTSAHGFDPAALAARKGRQRVAVCLPARDEAATVGTIVGRIHDELRARVGLVDELVVVDDHSRDATAQVAAAAGATVVAAREVASEHATGPGKGAALWTSLHETDADLVVWIDADLAQFDIAFVTGLVGTLLTRPEVSFVKGAYTRPVGADGQGGGRVTELLARPVLASLFPMAAGFAQPLSGEYGGRRQLLESLPFVQGYGVDIALLVDAIRTVGIDGVAECDLGVRHHRNRPLHELSAQATEVLRAALVRAGLDDEHAVVLRRPGHDPLLVPHHELPPLQQASSYRERRSA